jgi:DNA polymerase III subunit delta'
MPRFMVDTATDPRQTGLHPRLATQLVGHNGEQRRLREAIDSGKLHHAWLICGPQGIGKATLAYRLAAFVLGARREGLGLEIDHASQSARWIAAQAHPDLFVLERAYDAKTKKLKAEISVESARELLDFFAKTSGSGGWRVAIVDPADDLNKASGNALLKMIEEPPPQALLLLVCHQPGRILRTIRSRCSRLDLKLLSSAETREVVLLSLGDEPSESMALEAALGHAEGRPGLALELLASQGARTFSAFEKLPSLDPSAIVEFGNRFAARNTNAKDFEIFCSLLQRWLSNRAREDALTGRGVAVAQAHGAVASLLRETDIYNLDRRDAIVRALMLIDKALRAA